MKLEYTVVVMCIFQKVEVYALTGHVCTRQRAEQYMTSYNRGFICPERYTTACGQLDWRRCTKYRVQTCYTPTERYATRYVTVEECCPGWEHAGAGACTIPVCSGGCENGGKCIDDGGVPGCSCVEGFHGERCQTVITSVDAWKFVFIGVLCVIIVSLAAGLVVLYRRKRPGSASQHGLNEDPDITRPLVMPGDRTDSARHSRRDLSRLVHITWATGRNNERQPSAPVMNET